MIRKTLLRIYLGTTYRIITENDTDPKKVAKWKTCKFTFFS